MTVKLGKSRGTDLDTISDAYRRQYVQMHANNVNYGRGGLGNLEAYRKYLGRFDRPPGRILDYGCGKGWAVHELRRLYPDSLVEGYDPCIDEYAALPTMKFDSIYSTDVFEHFEPDRLVPCLEQIASFAAPGCCYFFLIAMRPANQTLPDGRNAHLIVENQEWWLDKIARSIPMVNGDHVVNVDTYGERTRLYVWGEKPE